jgi:hypothetical protein
MPVGDTSRSMLTGKKLILIRDTTVVEITRSGERLLTSLPKGSLIEVLVGPVNKNAAASVVVLCEQRTLEMFALDVAERGKEVLDKGATPN